MPKVLALTPVDLEFDAMTAAFTEFGYEYDAETIGELGVRKYLDGGLIVAQGGLGKAQFGVQTQYLIERIDGLELVVCAGTSGGLADSLSIGDVVVATETVEHDFDEAYKVLNLPPPRFAGDARSIEALKSLAAGGTGNEFSFNVHFGIVASGDTFVSDLNHARQLRETTGAYAAAWEGAGGARAAQFSGLPFLEVRGISDSAGANAMAEFMNNIPIAMRNVALVIRELPALHSLSS